MKNGDGDDAHPLCHELHAHMLLYVESGRAVDLGRAERLLRILIALMRSQRGCMASRMIVRFAVSLFKKRNFKISIVWFLSFFIFANFFDEFFLLHQPFINLFGSIVAKAERFQSSRFCRAENWHATFPPSSEEASASFTL